MRRSRFIVWLLLATLAAIAAAWFWALRPLLTILGYIYSSDWTDADVVRHIWHFRLVQPEWVSSPPDYSRWEQAETLARLSVVFLGWLASITFIIRRYLRSHKKPTPNQSRGCVKTPDTKIGNDHIFDMGNFDGMSRWGWDGPKLSFYTASRRRQRGMARPVPLRERIAPWGHAPLRGSRWLVPRA